MAFTNQCFAPSSSVSIGCGVNPLALRPLESAGSERYPGCGVQTHRYHRADEPTPMTAAALQPSPAIVARKEPLTVGERVCRGRCLTCQPLAIPPHLPGGGGAFTGRLAHTQPQHAGFVPREQDPRGVDSDEILDALCWMRRHPHDMQVQTSALRALWVLSWEADNARAIGLAGGVPAILETLRRHLRTHLGINRRYNRDGNTSSPSFMRQVRLQRNGLAALRNLTANAGNTKRLLEYDTPSCSEGVSFILLSTSTFAHDPEVASSGCGALANILSNERRCGGVVLDCGGLDVLARCVDAHRTDECVARSVHECLLMLGASDDYLRTTLYETWMRKGDITDMDDCSAEGEVSHFRGKVNGWGT